MKNSDSSNGSASAVPLVIAIADDMPEICAFVRECLKAAGHEVVCAANGAELRRLARGQRLDLVITDIMMPESDGFEVIADMRKLNPHIRIIAMSGGGKTMNGGDCLRVARTLGADAILAKPFNTSQLVSTVETVCRRSHRQPRA